MSSQQGTPLFPAVEFDGRTDLPDIKTPTTPPPPLTTIFYRQYTHPGTESTRNPRIRRASSRQGGWGKFGPVALPWTVVRERVGAEIVPRGGARPGSFRGSKRRPMRSRIFRMAGAWVMKPRRASTNGTTRSCRPKRARRVLDKLFKTHIEKSKDEPAPRPIRDIDLD